MAEDYVLGQGAEARVVPAGTPFYASEFPVIRMSGTAADPRDDYLNWCVAQRTAAVCFRWLRPGTVEISPVVGVGGQVFLQAPRGVWRAAPEPKLVEQPVALERYENLLVVKSIGETGVVLSDVSRQGADEWAFERPVEWGKAVSQWPGGPALRFTPVPGDGGQPKRAQVGVVPKERTP